MRRRVPLALRLARDTGPSVGRPRYHRKYRPGRTLVCRGGCLRPIADPGGRPGAPPLPAPQALTGRQWQWQWQWQWQVQCQCQWGAPRLHGRPLSLPCDSQWWPRVHRLSDPGGCGSPPFDSGRATWSSLTWPARAHSRGVTSRWPPPPPDSSPNRSLRLSDSTGLVVKSSKMVGEPTAGEAEGTPK